MAKKSSAKNAKGKKVGTRGKSSDTSFRPQHKNFRHVAEAEAFAKARGGRAEREKGDKFRLIYGGRKK